jgi:hypothetical protein
VTREKAIDLAWNAILNAYDMDATLNDYACAAVDALLASGFRYVGPDEVVVKKRVDLWKYGYAEGNYTCSCWICKNTFTGDKRAWTCKDCAMIEASEKEKK